MASGITLELEKFDRKMDYRRRPPWEQKPRDRSLRGKDRIRARKLANKKPVEVDDVG